MLHSFVHAECLYFVHVVFKSGGKCHQDFYAFYNFLSNTNLTVRRMGHMDGSSFPFSIKNHYELLDPHAPVSLANIVLFFKVYIQ